MKRASAVVALTLAVVATRARAIEGFTKYSEMTQTMNVTASVTSGAACSALQTAVAGADTITVAWSGVVAQTGGSLTIMLCYDTSELLSKPWRKKGDIIAKNKRCKQTVIESSELVKAVDHSLTTYSVPIPRNTAPAKYVVQVLNTNPTSGYTQYGESKCAFKINTYDRLPDSLVGTMSFLIAFSLVAGTAGYMLDRKKQNAIASEYM